MSRSSTARTRSNGRQSTPAIAIADQAHPSGKASHNTPSKVKGDCIVVDTCLPASDIAVTAMRASAAACLDIVVLDISNIEEICLKELMHFRKLTRSAIVVRLVDLDPEHPDTLSYVVRGMLETHFEPKEIASLVGASRTTVGRWAKNEVIPRSAPYRKWLVERLRARLMGVEGPDQQASDKQPNDSSSGRNGQTKPRGLSHLRSIQTATD